MENGSEGMAERERSMCFAVEQLDVLKVDERGGRYFERFGVDVIGIEDWKVSMLAMSELSGGSELYIELLLLHFNEERERTMLGLSHLLIVVAYRMEH